MGLDLSLLPFDLDSPGLCFSHTILFCDRYSILFDEIKSLFSFPVPDPFYSFLCKTVDPEEGSYGNTQVDPYGKPLRYTEAGALAGLSGHVGVQSYLKNQAIWSYLSCLPPQTKVALYWE